MCFESAEESKKSRRDAQKDSTTLTTLTHSMKRVFIITVVVAAVIGVFCVYEGVTTSLQAERALHATLLTTALVNDYIDRHQGEWPRSWSDPEAMPSRQWAMYNWPEDSRKVQKYVFVDFAADLRQLATQSTDEFDAIRPTVTCYDFKHYGAVEKLLVSIRTGAAH